jgi:crossover junction endodeoxyribonuclease RuvC
MRILGIDPGLKTTGYGIIETSNDISGEKKYSQRRSLHLIDAGAIFTKYQDGLKIRLTEIYQPLMVIMDKFQPDFMVVEKLYSHYKHPLTAVLMAHARGVVYLTAGIKHIPIKEYSATQIKKALTGSGHARKQQIQQMVSHILKLPENYFRQNESKPEDTSDALALALGFIFIEQKNRALLSAIKI